MGSGETGCGCGVVGESEREREEEDVKGKEEVGSDSVAASSMRRLRFWALIERGVGSGVIGVTLASNVGSLLRGEVVGGDKSLWSGSSSSLARLRVRGVSVREVDGGVIDEGVAGDCLRFLLVKGGGVVVEGVGGRAICLRLRRTEGNGKGVEGPLGMYWTAICREKLIKADLEELGVLWIEWQYELIEKLVRIKMI